MSALAVAAGPEERERDDLDLVAAVRAGDDRAFETLFLRYQPRIAAYVGGMVRDHGRAEDITQEVFMAALRRLRTDDEREILFRPWIYEIAKNKCIDAYRRGRNTTEVSFDADDQVGAADHGRLAAPGATPDAAVEGKLAFDNLRGAFDGLSPVHHEILVMREFEGLSYREIGDRLGMSRTAVESTLFRARKRLGEEYEELVSGKRCLRVQQIVDASGGRATGLRDQRRVARHLAHCQPCRRHAHLAGADLGLLRPPSVASRVAAFLPLPAFLRRRLEGGEAGTHMLGQQAARPTAQWSAQIAGGLDPGAVSGWAKAAATAVTVALAGMGGSAIEHRGPVAASPAAAAAAGGAAGVQALSGTPRGEAPSLSLPAGQAAAAGSTNASSPSSSSSTSAASSSPPPSSADGDPRASGDPGAARSPAAAGPDPTAGAADPQDPLSSAPDPPLAPVPDAVGDTSRGIERPGGTARDAPTGAPSDPGRLVRPIVPPAVPGVPLGADEVLPKLGGDKVGRADDAPAAARDVPAPGRSADAPSRDVVTAKGAPAPTPTAAVPSLGG
jgi:RNA polymerase sigma factor (sigma-70 family)